MKVAFTGSSGSGKTTLVKFVEKEFNLKHISGSAGDVKLPEDEEYLISEYGTADLPGHAGVISLSAQNIKFGIDNQLILQKRRNQIISENYNFVTDRSPIDNLTYFVNQVGFHPDVTDEIVKNFIDRSLEAWMQLTHVIFVRAVQPKEIENNGSRVANIYYQKSIDAQFAMWLDKVFMPHSFNNGPKLLVLDFWNLDARKNTVREFLSH